jgi:hypothetical protein
MAIFYTNYVSATIMTQVSLLPPDCITRVSGQDSQQQRTRGLTKISQIDNSTIQKNTKVVN